MKDDVKRYWGVVPIELTRPIGITLERAVQLLLTVFSIVALVFLYIVASKDDFRPWPDLAPVLPDLILLALALYLGSLRKEYEIDRRRDVVTVWRDLSIFRVRRDHAVGDILHVAVLERRFLPWSFFAVWLEGTTKRTFIGLFVDAIRAVDHASSFAKIIDREVVGNGAAFTG